MSNGDLEHSLWDATFAALGGLGGGLTSGFMQAVQLRGKSASPGNLWKGVALFALYFSACSALVVSLYTVPSMSCVPAVRENALGRGIYLGVCHGIFCGLMFGVRLQGRGLSEEIRSVELLRSRSWTGAWLGGRRGLVCGLAFGVPFAFFSGAWAAFPGNLDLDPVQLVFFVDNVVLCSLLGPAIGVIVGGLKGAVATGRSRPQSRYPAVVQEFLVRGPVILLDPLFPLTIPWESLGGPAGDSVKLAQFAQGLG